MIGGVFEPLMAADGLLARSIGQLIGVGPGRGAGLLFMVMGLLSMLASAGSDQLAGEVTSAAEPTTA